MEIAKVRERLARKALYQPNTRFDDLFSLVAHPHALWIAAESVRESSGAAVPGVDGVTAGDLGSDLRAYAEALSAELKAGGYTPQAVREIEVSRADGTPRTVGLATVRDRIVQEAVRQILEPILESHFLNCSTGYRPGRRAMDAIHLITRFANNNVKMWWTVGGRIVGGFSSIPHRKLKGVLRQYLRDKKLLALIADLLGAGIVVRGKVATPNRGVTQAGLLAPLLANAYLHEIDKAWWERYGSLTQGQKTYRRQKGLGNVQYIRHADDLVLLTNGDKTFAHELRDEFREIVAQLGLELAAEETQVRHLNDGIEFLGFRLRRVHSAMSNKSMVLVKPTKENVQRFKEAMRAITDRSTIGDDPVNKIRALNALVRHWTDYYRHANVRDEFVKLGSFVHMRMYRWLKAKHSSVSARASVKKFVVQRYLTRYRGNLTWGVHGVKLIPMKMVKRRRYYISWPAKGNPYLEPGATALRVTDPVPIPDPEQIWRGHSEQSAYAVARLERLEQVGHRCEACGSSEGYLHAHHVVPRREGGRHTVENLRILCEACHVNAYSEQ